LEGLCVGASRGTGFAAEKSAASWFANPEERVTGGQGAGVDEQADDEPSSEGTGGSGDVNAVKRS